MRSHTYFKWTPEAIARLTHLVKENPPLPFRVIAEQMGCPMGSARMKARECYIRRRQRATPDEKEVMLRYRITLTMLRRLGIDKVKAMGPVKTMVHRAGIDKVKVMETPKKQNIVRYDKHPLPYIGAKTRHIERMMQLAERCG
jgi:hypothetical protein